MKKVCIVTVLVAFLLAINCGIPMHVANATFVLGNTADDSLVAEDEVATPARYGKTNTKGVNMRGTANTKGTLVEQINITGSYVQIMEEVQGKDNKTWYATVYEGEEGFIRADLVDEILPEDEEYMIAQTSIEEGRVRKESSSGSSGGNGSSSGGKSGSRSSSSGKSSSSSGGSSSSSGSKVWVTSSGKSYHSSSQCSNMGNPKQITRDEAVSSGRTKCPKCW